MFLKNRSFAFALVAASVVVGLFGCGGGGGSIMSDVGGIPTAARNQPLAGSDSVTQSSVGMNGTTVDDISVMVNYRPGGRVDYRVANGREWS